MLYKQTYEDDTYVDYERELISFPDEGNTSIDCRITLDKEEKKAWASIVRHNNDGDTSELLDIPLTFEDAEAMAKDEG